MKKYLANTTGSIFMEQGLLIALCVAGAIVLIAAVGAIIIDNWQAILDTISGL